MDNPADMINAALEELIKQRKVWQDRLAWLMELGAMEPLLKDIPPAIVKHFAAEARALDASELQDYETGKRLTLLACLIRQTQMSTQDDLIDMFLT